MKKIALAIAISGVFYSQGFCQEKGRPVVTPSSAESAGMSAERLQQTDRLLQQAIADRWTNAAVALVIRDGKIVYYKSFGFDDEKERKQVKRDAIFRIASQTKAITSVAIMMLYEEGKFLLDDPVSKYIPEFKNPVILDTYSETDTVYTTVPAKHEITIRHLLTHTSGIAYAQIGSGPLNAIYAKAKIPCGLGFENGLLADEMKKLASMPLLHEPGMKFTYGLNTDVLGYLVELISGMSLDDFFRKKIFAPLGMHDTFFYLPQEKQNRLVSLHVVDDSGGLIKSPGYFEVNGNLLKDYPKANGKYYSGGAGLSSTIMDYAIFLQMLLNGGEYNGKRLLSRSSIRLMTTNQVGQLQLGASKFGLGFRIATDQSSALLPMQKGTFSWGGAFSTTYWVDPEEKIIGLLYRQLWNDRHEDELADKFKVSVYQAIDN